MSILIESDCVCRGGGGGGGRGVGKVGGGDGRGQNFSCKKNFKKGGMAGVRISKVSVMCAHVCACLGMYTCSKVCTCMCLSRYVHMQ